MIDEGHAVKNPMALQSKTAQALTTECCWILSGTPMNNINDLKGQMNVLGIYPTTQTCNDQLFSKWNNLPTAKPKYQMLFKTLMERTMMRHVHKQSFAGRQNLITLPNKHVETIVIPFSEPQQHVYDTIFQNVRAKFREYARRGKLECKKMEIMTLLTPLRHACSGCGTKFDLNELKQMLKDGDDSLLLRLGEREVAGLDIKLKEAKDFSFNAMGSECSICLDVMDNPVQTICRHAFCLECIMAIINGPLERCRCPQCRQTLNQKSLFKPKFEVPKKKEGEGEPEKKEEEGEKVEKTEEEGGKVEKVVMNAKIEQLMKELKKLKEEDKTAKAIVFTQFSETINLLCSHFKQKGVAFRMICGGMTIAKRKKALDDFESNEQIGVLILSMRTGSVGLNLTRANHVFIIEPCLNPALEMQAIGRVYRIGQPKEVFVKYLVMKDSVEEKMMSLNKTKMVSLEAASASVSSSSSSKAPSSQTKTLNESELSFLFQN